jgi:RHS repeat-associated protein
LPITNLSRFPCQVNADGTYTYDNANELTGAYKSGTQSESYSYDVNGNRTGTGYSTTIMNETATSPGVTYSYDNAGNTISEQTGSTTTTFTYDYRNRLTEVATGGTVVATYTYNALDQRIGVKENSTQTWTAYAGTSADANPYADFNGSGALTMRYLFSPGATNGGLLNEVLGRTSSGGTTAWYLTDQLGSVRDIVSTSGSSLDHIVYDSFGNVVTETNASNGDRLTGFAGLDRDTVTGLNLAVYRQENPRTGKWDTLDPLRFGAGDADLSRYAGNSPADEVDPSGLQVSFMNKKTREPVEFTLANPAQTIVLVGPPHKPAPGVTDPQQYVRPYFRQKGVPDENIIDYTNPGDLKAQLLKRGTRRGRFDVVLWNHGAPGIIAVQYNRDRLGASTLDPTSLTNLETISRILYDFNPINVWATGCSTCMHLDGTGAKESKPFFDYLKLQLPTDTYVWGTIGEVSVAPINDDADAPIGIFIEKGGALQVPASSILRGH